jgi:hypothetical protein
MQQHVVSTTVVGLACSHHRGLRRVRAVSGRKTKRRRRRRRRDWRSWRSTHRACWRAYASASQQALRPPLLLQGLMILVGSSVWAHSSLQQSMPAL